MPCPDEVPTPDDILNAIGRDLVEGIQSATDDAGSATAMSPLERQKAADLFASRKALQGANPQGGAKSPFNRLRAARYVPPGTT